jgi:hypothetical protein
VAILYAISLPLSGLFAIRCFRATDRLRRYVSFLSLSVTRRSLIASILKERAAIVNEIEKRKEEYLRTRTPRDEKFLPEPLADPRPLAREADHPDKEPLPEFPAVEHEPHLVELTEEIPDAVSLS